MAAIKRKGIVVLAISGVFVMEKGWLIGMGDSLSREKEADTSFLAGKNAKHFLVKSEWKLN